MRYQDKSDYYITLADEDIIGRIEHLFRNEGYFIQQEDGKITAELKPSWETPWHHINDSSSFDCYRWHTIIFNVLGFIASGCMNCFKVVVRPDNLKQLFALLDLQLELDRPSKCGIEIRPNVRGLYGGYFYNHGLVAGLDCFRLVKDSMAKDKVLSPLLDYKDEHGVSQKIILKRGCTEFEMKYGRSDQWCTTEKNLKLESLINAYIVKKSSMVQTDIMIKNLHSRWVRFAWEHGDPTVDEFTSGVPLYPPVVTYHHVVELREAV